MFIIKTFLTSNFRFQTIHFLRYKNYAILFPLSNSISVRKFNITHIYVKPLHPQTQGKIERYHRSMKNVIKLNHYFCPSEQENTSAQWVEC